ncbi:MAG: hypothetical protein CVT94_04305 [Bacteroidetes bacterium HGW-Bacteroidetes-11]|jgi:hypothetical protein|nr:MAG: hypothetical protein CVT94_04305 [Bacteroidetes bacterium HGW-Bacteroidetes-11]
MKKLSIIIVSLGFLFVTEAQTWKIPVYRQTDESRVQTLKFTHRTQLTIRTQLPQKDSVKENITWQGLFHSGSQDSLVIKLESFKSCKEFPGEIRQTTTIPAETYLKNSLPGNDLVPFALDDIGFLSYQKRSKLIGKADDILEPVIFASLFVMILSPLISYDFNEGQLNTERYKNWALGSTLTMTSCFAVLMAINLPNQQKKYQFRSGWPEKKAKVWKFR